MSGSVVMQLSDLSIGYQHQGQAKPLIRSLHTNVLRGEVVCLLGQNGVGKSTLLRTLAGIQPPLSGKIYLNQRDLSTFSTQELAWRISIVLTEKISAGNLSVYDLVALGRHPYTNWLGILTASDKAKVDEAIALTKINYLAEKKIGELSDGQYQKAMIARAVAQDGELMILDEPTAFLDLNNSVEIFLLLRQLAHEKNKAIVVSTHDFHLAMEFADKLWLSNFNSPLYQGLPEDLGLNGRLEESMFHEGFGLDLLTGGIVLSKKEKGKVKLEGNTPAHHWTRRALERNGFTLSESADAIHVSIENKNGVVRWIAGQRDFDSIHTLLNFLTKESKA